MDAPVVGQAHGQLLDAAAAGAVRAEAGVPRDARHRADVDDPAVAARDHLLRHRLCDEEGAAQVGVDHKVPIVPGHVDGGLAHVAAGVVDEDVDLAVVGMRGFDHGPNAAVIADVERERQCPPPERLDFSAECVERIDVSAGDDEVGAGACERPAHVLAKPAAGAGDDGDFAGEIELGDHFLSLLWPVKMKGT